MNFGLAQSEIQKLAAVRLEVIRRGTGKVMKTTDIPADAALLAAQLTKIPLTAEGPPRPVCATTFPICCSPIWTCPSCPCSRSTIRSATGSSAAAPAARMARSWRRSIRSRFAGWITNRLSRRSRA